LGVHDRIPFEYSTRGLEFLYHKTGVRLQGLTELRWAWKFNDLKPRIYYARGPSQYYDAKYIQQLFNKLIDTIPVCHKRERYFTSTIKLSADELFFIYDYESFTSCLEEIKQFSHALGDFFSGYHSTFIDTFQGPIIMDVGEMIHQWNRSCNIYPSFDSGKAVWESSESTLTEVTHSCGMLGVPGNISSCTLLHAVHLAILLVSLLCKVVGDDAAGSCMEEDYPSIFRLLTNIGKLEESKSVRFLDLSMEADLENTNDRAWHYLKRPINRLDNFVVSGDQVVWPSEGMIRNQIPSYRRGVRAGTDKDIRKKTAASLCSFVRQLRFIQVSAEEEEFCDRYISWAIETSGLGRDVDSDGCLLSYEFVYPTSLGSWRSFESMMQVWGHRVVTLPDPGLPSSEVARGRDIILRSNRALKLGRDLGYVSMAPRYMRVFGKDEPDLMKRVFFDKDRVDVFYDVVISWDIPEWLFDLISGNPSTHVPLDDYEDVFPYPESPSSSVETFEW